MSVRLDLVHRGERRRRSRDRAVQTAIALAALLYFASAGRARNQSIAPPLPRAAPQLAAGAAPLDLAIVFDLTGSMQGSIDSVRRSAENLIRQLNEESGDFRVALVGYRDIADGKNLVEPPQPFTSDVAAQLRVMDGWTARGGGEDAPEDALHAIDIALRFPWRRWGHRFQPVTKIVVLITDAGYHDPDFDHNTAVSIAERARALGVRIDPIIIGDADIKAVTNLARYTGGSVLNVDSAATGRQLLKAVHVAVTEQRAAASETRPVLLLILFVAAVSTAVLRIGGLTPRAAFRMLASP